MRRFSKIQRVVNSYLAEREYRPLYHAICVAVIVSAACFLFYKNFTNRGMLMAVDMTWPNTLSRIQFKTVNTWYPFGSIPSSATLQWIFWIYPSSMVARLLHLSASAYMLLLFIFTFSLAGVAMYTLTYKTILDLRFKGMSGYAPFVGSVFAGVVYMYNPWSLHYFRPYFAYPIYALTPLLFLAMVKTFDRPTVRNVVLFALFVTIANTSYNQTWFIGLFGSYLVFFILKNRFGRSRILDAAKVTAGTAAVYLLLNATWVTPYVSAQLTGRPMLPFYSPQLTENMLRGLSFNNSMSNNLRLLSIWSWSIEKLPGGLLLQALAFSMPLLVLVSLIVLRRDINRNTTVNYWAAVAVLALLLATGTSSIVKPLYKWMVLRAPGSGSFGWLLRVPERFLFFVAPFFALMLGLLASRMLLKRPGERPWPAPISGLRRFTYSADLSQSSRDRKTEAETAEDRITRFELSQARKTYRNSLLLAGFIIAIVTVSLYPKALDFGQHIFNPASVPGDYAKVDEFVRRTGDNRVTWIPFYGPSNFVYSWAPEKKVSWFNVMISNPGLSSVYEVMNAHSYFNWLQSLYVEGGIPEINLPYKNLMLRNDIMSRLLWPFSTRYLIHDTSVEGYDFDQNLDKDKSITPVYGTKLLKVYEPKSAPSYFWPATVTLKADSFFDNLAILQKMPAEQTEHLAFIDGPSYFGAKADLPKKYGLIKMKDFTSCINQNPGFEDTTNEGFPWYWTEYTRNRQAKITTDTRVKSNGKRSLKIVNSSKKNMDLAIMIGEEVRIPSNCVLSFQTSIKYQNSNWTFAALEGYRSDTRNWIQLAQCPTLRSGNSDWETYECSVNVPSQVTRVRPVISGGWSRDAQKGPAVTWFDETKISIVHDGLFRELAPKSPPPKITFARISAEEYKVSVRGATDPFVLVQSESHDPLWTATYSDGTQIEPIPTYSTINGYPIDRKGDFELTIRYLPQNWFYLGLFISLIALLGCASYLVYDWKRPIVTLRRRSPRDVRLFVRLGQSTRYSKNLQTLKEAGGAGLRRVTAVVSRTVRKIRAIIEEPPK